MEQYKCQSYYDDNNELQDCTCGKCEFSIKSDKLKKELLEEFRSTLPQDMKLSLNKVKESTYYPWLKKIADKKIEILINKNIEDELELELDDLIELVQEMEQKKAIDEYRKGYNQRLKDEGKTGEDYQGLYL